MATPIATTTTTIKQTSNIDDLFKNLNFSPQPQQQQQMPMSQTMPNIFQLQQVNPSTRQSTVIINFKLFKYKIYLVFR
jgi:hypothetical protein